jgi:hypothetical protein
LIKSIPDLVQKRPHHQQVFYEAIGEKNRSPLGRAITPRSVSILNALRSPLKDPHERRGREIEAEIRDLEAELGLSPQGHAKGGPVAKPNSLHHQLEVLKARGEKYKQELAHFNPQEMAFLKANPGLVKDVTSRYKALAKKGQGGDTRLGRISSTTARLLDQLIHHGHREVNERTGLREYMEGKKTKYVEEEKNPIAPDNLYSFQKQLNLSHIDKNDQQKRADLVKQRILKRHPKIKSIEENNLSPLILLKELQKIGIDRIIAVDTKDYPTTAEMSEFENENLYKLWKTQNPNEFNQTYMEFMDKNKKPQAFQTKNVDKEFDKWGQSAIKSIQDSKSNKCNRSVYVPSQKTTVGGLYGCGIAATDANEKMLLKKLDQKKTLTPTEEKELGQRLFDLEEGMNSFSHTDNPALHAAMYRMNQKNQKINEKNKDVTKDYRPIPDISLSQNNNLQDLYSGSGLDWHSTNINKVDSK